MSHKTFCIQKYYVSSTQLKNDYGTDILLTTNRNCMDESIDGKEVCSSMTFQPCSGDSIIVISYIVLNCSAHQDTH